MRRAASVVGVAGAAMAEGPVEARAHLVVETHMAASAAPLTLR